MSWWDELQQASFRGVPFGVLGGEGRFGRRVVSHAYPFRDVPYIEDLGRSTRRIMLAGFLIEDSLVYGGGSVIAQREQMIAAAETAGPGTLIHPSLGPLTVSIPDGGLGIIERWDEGRYFELNFTFIEAGMAHTSASTPTIATLMALGAEDRARVATACAAMAKAASRLDAATVASFPSTAQAVTVALSGAMSHPGDAVRLFELLGAYQPSTIVAGTGQTPSAQVIAEAATGALLRRAAIGALARAVAVYVPTSYDDAANVRAAVTACIDNEILVAGDAGDDGSYAALRALRQGVVSTLSAVGATRAPLQTVTFHAPLPALVLAQRLYQDASRADQLVSEADPIHPAFMPRKFRVLAS
ncbi:DNA circularization N-terminal domain-containing protein [Dyella sp. M7H15-1]|uniref:DNA circularization protein n=1 Tax=Dyella sp. M7H15-1 TaxID=2501295 RepID=UPI00197AF228|nr:DNA circularization N-terminal domain-containing protein [Dyella sp. M7H15-1]